MSYLAKDNRISTCTFETLAQLSDMHKVGAHDYMVAYGPFSLSTTMRSLHRPRSVWAAMTAHTGNVR